MIDDKKIEGAKDSIFNKHFLKNNEGMICIDHISEPVYLDYQIKQAIELGAKWAINEFLKNLFHPASEEPEKNRRCLIRVVYHPNHEMLPDEERIEQSSFHDFGWYNYDFKYIGTNYDIISWLYVDDLFPKEGGEQ